MSNVLLIALSNVPLKVQPNATGSGMPNGSAERMRFDGLIRPSLVHLLLRVAAVARTG